MKFSNVKDKVYLLIPLLCASFWILLSLIKDSFYLLDAADFDVIYYASNNIFTNPGEVYTAPHGDRYFYLPSFATLFGLIATFFPYNISIWIYFGMLCVFTYFLIGEFNNLLEHSGVDMKLQRFLLLFVIANSYSILMNFDWMQTKIISSYFLIIFLRREIQYHNNEIKYTDFKFKFHQMMIFVFGIGLIPHYAFFFMIIYLFHGVSWKEIFTRSQMAKYGLFVLTLCIQNFMIFIIIIFNPDTISYILSGFSVGFSGFPDIMSNSMIANQECCTSVDVITLILYLFNSFIDLSPFSGIGLMLVTLPIIFIISFLLAFKKEFTLELKFAYQALAFVFLLVFYHYRDRVIIITLISLLFIVSLNKEKNILRFINENFFWFLGLFCLLIINLFPPNFYLFRLIKLPIVLVFGALILVYMALAYAIYLFRIKQKLFFPILPISRAKTETNTETNVKINTSKNE